MWPRAERHFIAELVVVSLALGAYFVTELLSESDLMMRLLLTLTHSINTAEDWLRSVFLDPSAPDGGPRGRDLFVDPSKQDMFTKFWVSRMKGNRWRPVVSEVESLTSVASTTRQDTITLNTHHSYKELLALLYSPTGLQMYLSLRHEFQFNVIFEQRLLLLLPCYTVSSYRLRW